jgi:hypothetical protein
VLFHVVWAQPLRAAVIGSKGKGAPKAWLSLLQSQTNSNCPSHHLKQRELSQRNTGDSIPNFLNTTATCLSTIFSTSGQCDRTGHPKWQSKFNLPTPYDVILRPIVNFSTCITLWSYVTPVLVCWSVQLFSLQDEGP